MAEKIELKINFSDVWTEFNKTNNFFYNLLAEKYQVIIADKPDLLFYFLKNGAEHVRYTCTKILFTGESERPDFFECDFAFSYDYPVTNKNYRLPLYALYGDVNKLLNRDINGVELLKSKKKFCCFVVSNELCKERNDFFHMLSKYKKVDSGGSVFNNIGGRIENKLEFIKDYKFTIAFENASYPGYTTEKVFEPLMQNTVPIYWGNPLVNKDFNTRSFINCHDYPSFEEAVKQVIAADQSDELYLKYLTEPAFNNDELNEFVKKENILKRLDEIVAFHFNGKTKVYPNIRPAYFYFRSAIKRSAGFSKRALNKIKASLRFSD